MKFPALARPPVPPKRKIVTLIAGFRCTDGAVMCADSQETVGDYRVSVHKLEPFTAGNFQVGIAGSGNSGDLIDEFVRRIEDNLNDHPLTTLKQFKDFCQAELLEFSKNEAMTYPAKQRAMSFLLCARALTGEPDFEMWVTSGRRLRPVARRALVGWDISLYRHIADQFYCSPSEILPVSQTILVALRLFALARNTSNTIGGPTTVAIVHKNGFGIEDPVWIEKLEQRINVFDSQFKRLMVACPDTSVPAEKFQEMVSEFQKSITYLREDYFTQTAALVFQSIIRRFNDPSFGGDIYARIPPGSVVTLMEDGSVIARQPDAEESAKIRAIRESVKAAQDEDKKTGDPE
jgi:ATP-dependent protease HslVU (ClpYQ) peptidase subunit